MPRVISNDQNTAAWALGIASDSAERCVQVLRQVAAARNVTGLSGRIVALAGSSDDEVRMWASEALESAVVAQPEEVADLVTLLRESGDGEVSYWSATLLGRLGRHSGDAVTALEHCLRTSMYLPARERAAWALSQIGSAAAPAMPALRIAAVDGPPRLKRLAIEALEAIRGVAA